MNKLLSLLLLFIPLTLEARTWSTNMKDAYLELEMTSTQIAPYSEGESVEQKGYFCLKKEKPSKKCFLLTPEDLDRYEVKFFYPNPVTEITGEVTLSILEDRHEFTFTTPDLKTAEKPSFTATVSYKGSKSDMYQRALAKIQALREKLLAKKNYWPAVGSTQLKDYAEFLGKLESKIQGRLELDESLIALRTHPLQIANAISSRSRWSHATQDWQVEAGFSLGNLFEGESTWIEAKFAPYLINKGEWKLDIYFDDVLLKSERSTDPTTQKSFRLLSPELSSGDHKLRIVTSRWESNKWNPYFDKVFHHFAFADTAVPEFTNITPAPGRYVSKTTHSLSYDAIDHFGRINEKSIKAIFQLQKGGELDLSQDLNFLTDGEVLVPELHGNQAGGSVFHVSGTFNNLPEGIHQLSLQPEDFAGNAAQGASWEFVYDRTAPLILLPFQETFMTNDVSFELPVTIADLTQTSFKVFVNGAMVYDEFTGQTDFSETFAIDLVEGMNLVRVEAVDEVGNSSSVDYPPIFLDTTPPELLAFNLYEGQLIRNKSFSLEGKSNEKLRMVQVNGNEIDMEEGAIIFTHLLEHLIDGDQTVDLLLEDLAGNQIEFSYGYKFLLKLIDPDLIEVAKLDEEHLQIIGYPGASHNGLQISAEDGLFNSDETVAAEDGSFSLTLKNFIYAKVTAFDPSRNRGESAVVDFKPDTTFAGAVRDVNDNPLPNVKVTIVSSGQYTHTDTNGNFSIKNPSLGDQLVTIDGRTISLEVTQGLKEFSIVSINVNLGNKQKNILERPIYLAPKHLDGTETPVEVGVATTVTSSYAPGVSLEVPANSATFPDGSKIGAINILEIPADKTSVEVLEEARPDTVYALEPSGLKFNQRVALTLPNLNEFPEGMELVILSKNSATGNWEPDGSATVVGDSIETKPGQGISHFSEVYAAPLGLQMKAFRDGDKPSFDVMNGAVSTSIQLPSFKAMGQDVSPALVYSSAWSNPNVVISNIFDIPRQEYVADPVSQSVGHAMGKVKVKASATSWLEPDFIDAQFFTSNFASEKIRFTGLPNKSLVSYQMDLSSVPSGIHPAKSSYEVHFKHLILHSMKIKEKNWYGKTKVRHKSWVEEKVLEEIFPQDLITTIYHQNKKDSEAGAGWRLGLGKKILNPDQDRVMVETESGQIGTYTLKNSVENIHHDEKGINTFSVNGSEIASINTEGEVVTTNNGSSSVSFTLPRYEGRMGVNTSWHVNTTRKCTKSGWSGCRKHAYTYYFQCNKFDVDYSTPRTAVSMMVRGGEVIYLDKRGALFGANPLTPIAGYYASPVSFKDATTATSENSFQSHCKSLTGSDCKAAPRFNLNSYIISSYQNPYNQVGWCNDTGMCNSGNCTSTWSESSGKVPVSGFEDGNNTYARFNSPMAFVEGAEPGSFLVADYGNNVIRKVSTYSNQTSIIAGNKQTADSGDGGLALEASFYHPRGVLQLTDGSFLVSTENGYIRKVTTDGKINSYIGKPTAKGGNLTDIESMQNMALNSPSGMVLDSNNGYLYIADTGHHRILRVDLNSEEARVVAGNGTCVEGDNHAGKTALEVSICRPEQIALDTNGNLLYLDSANKLIRRVNFMAPEDGLIRYQSIAKDNSELLRNSDGQFLLKTRDGKETLFSASGLETQTIDRVGRKTSYLYDASNRLREAILPTGQKVQISYSGSKISQITDGAGRNTTFYYNGDFLSSVSFPDGSERQYTYNAAGVLIEETNERGQSTQYRLNNWNRLSQIVRPDGTSVSMDDGVSKTISNQNTSDYPGELKSLETDQNILADVIRDASGNETKMNKDLNGYVQSITDSENKVTTIERDAEGRPIKITRPDLSFTQMTYDPNTGDMLERYESASGIKETYAYNFFGQLVSYTDPLNHSKQNIYDPNTGLLLKEVDPNGNFVQNTYNNLGLILTSTNKLGLTTTYTYGSSGNVETVTAPMGEITTYVRDSSGNVISKTNAKSQTTQYGFDSHNRLLSVTTPGNHTTSYSYLATGELAEILNPEGHKTLFDYDELGRLKKKTSPRGQITQLFYDNNDNVIREITPKGDEKTFVYDNKNQLLSKTLVDDTYNYHYDSKGNLTSASNTNSTVSMNYVSILGKDYLKTINTEALNIPQYGITYTYNAAGKRIGMDSPYLALTYGLDDAYRVTSVTNDKGQSFGFSYDEANRLTSINRSNGMNTSYAFDSNSFLKEILHQKGNSLIDSFIYNRDQIGNRTSMTTPRGVHSYGYDDENQLVTATHPEADELHALETFSYDSLGNRMTDNLGNFSYDDKKYRLEEDYRYLYTYDLNGNLTNKQEKGLSGKVWVYSYTTENQLIRAEMYEGMTKVKTANYFYDVFGKRIRKTVEDHSNNTYLERSFVYDGNEIISELDDDLEVLAVHTHSGLRTDDVLSTEVTPAGASRGLASVSGTYHYLKDGLGSVTGVTTDTGSLVQRYVYSSFGKLLKTVDASGIEGSPLLKTSYTYTNREFDEETGLYYYRARYYDSHSGRFLQEDPHTKLLENGLDRNYVYVDSNSTNLTDPTGRWIFMAFLVGGLLNAALSKGDFLANFLIGGAAGVAGGGAGVLLGGALGAAGGIGAAALKGFAVGAVTGMTATATSLALSGESLTSGRSIGKILIAGAIGGVVGGAIGAWKYNAPKPLKVTLDKAENVVGEPYNQGGQELFNFTYDAMRMIECAPLLHMPSSYKACMGN